MAVASATQINDLYAQALAHQKAGRYPAALKAYQSILDLNPRVAEVHYQVAIVLNQTNRFPGALKHAQAAAAIKPSEPAIWKVWAEALALGGDPAAEKTFLAALKSATLPIELKLTLQDRFGARRSATRPLTGGVPPQEIRRLLGLMNAGRAQQAESAAMAVLVQHPQSAIVMNIAATAQAMQGKSMLAEATYRQILRIDPNYAEAYDNLGRFLIDLKREEEATPLFRQAVILAPGLPSALVNLATALSRSDQHDAAFVLLERARAQGVDTYPLHMAIGDARLKLKDNAGAEAAYRRALVLSKGESAEAESMLGQIRVKEGKDDEALVHLDRALALNPNLASALSSKASLMQTLGQFDVVDELFRRSMAADPNNGETYRVFITSHKTEPGDPIIATMKERYADPRLSETDRMNLGFALAKALEDVREDEEVFKYLNAANAAMRRMQPHSMDHRYRAVELTKKAYRGTDWASLVRPGRTACAPIYVTGMPRSGTTLVEQIIASHSTVTSGGEIGDAVLAAHRFMAGGAEARPLGEVPEEEITRLGHDLGAFYAERFGDVAHITDKSIQTYMHMGLIKLAMPNARFIVVRRDPRDNLLSMYKNKFPENAHPYAYDQRELALYYGTFVDMIDFWRSEIPDWFYEVQYEKLVANPEEEARKLISACGLEWEDACLNFHENKNKVKTLSIYQVRQPISKKSVKGWQRFEKDLKPMLDALREGGHVTD
ncbi:tetratricopeptide repeat-containing sulfotransferase family protein [Albidovulum sediminis]|uniref:Sulfotransferase n=1 Tax=Albidovulum sediminis TaxID=3066345 RepID=A0ABT2NQ78_9RHOB|nr:tetratricopeptide repeat-containing sulfotransferase family protein [Defluviimonas sediminis]MCT8331056.1 sulfotransferase [Defluviimonas sediminis]